MTRILTPGEAPIPSESEILRADAAKTNLIITDGIMSRSQYREVQLNPHQTVSECGQLLKYAMMKASLADEDHKKKWIDVAAWAIVLMRSAKDPRTNRPLVKKVDATPKDATLRPIWKATRARSRRFLSDHPDPAIRATQAFLAIKEHYRQVLEGVPGISTNQEEIKRRLKEDPGLSRIDGVEDP